MEVVRLDRRHVKEASEAAAASFHDYPMFSLVFPDPGRRTRYLSWYLRNVLKCALRYGEVYTTRDISGVVFTLPAGHTRVSLWEYIRNGFLPTPFVLGLRNYRQSMEYLSFAEHTQEELTRNRPHCYLWGLAVRPHQQRRGIGAALMRPVLAQADALRVPVYLETHDERNVQYYRKHGFELIHAARTPRHGLPLWCMLREPVQTEPQL